MFSTHISKAAPTQGRFIISLDFEQAWGMEPHKAYGAERGSILGARDAIPRILDLAVRYGIRGTWATVGLLFFGDREELLGALPDIRPHYSDPALSPYTRLDQLGPDERADPLHFGRSLIRLIRDCPGQEVAGHTFSHYYCLEDGGGKDAFAADLAAAGRAAATLDITLKSIVFPRNQVRISYLPTCHAAGYRAFRGAQNHHAHHSRPRADETLWARMLRAADNYVSLPGHATGVDRPHRVGQMLDIRASRFLRPAASGFPLFPQLQLRRIRDEMTLAARERGTYHLWWHPHNFGARTDLQLAMLEAIFQHYRRLSHSHGMVSATMDSITQEHAHPAPIALDA